MTARPALIAMPTPEELADVLAVAAQGGDLPTLAAACRTYAARCSEPGRSRCLQGAAMLELGACVMAALELAKHSPGSP